MRTCSAFTPVFVVFEVLAAVPGRKGKVVGKDAVAEYPRTEVKKVLGHGRLYISALLLGSVTQSVLADREVPVTLCAKP